jgi:hypothetical protein
MVLSMSVRERLAMLKRGFCLDGAGSYLKLNMGCPCFL